MHPFLTAIYTSLAYQLMQYTRTYDFPLTIFRLKVALRFIHIFNSLSMMKHPNNRRTAFL